MPLSPALAIWLRERNHDAVHASELALDRSPDSEIISRAKYEGWVVITVDLDYPRLLALAHQSEPGLILFRDGSWSDAEIVARMDDLLRALTPEAIESSIIVVERDRIRRRRLPIGG